MKGTEYGQHPAGSSAHLSSSSAVIRAFATLSFVVRDILLL